jgi:hypothetical protein
MISHESPSPRGYQSHGYPRPYGHGQTPHYSQKPPVAEDTLKSDKVQIERKTFVFTLKENPRGRFLRITEDVNGRRDTIIVPATGLADFKRLLETMVDESDKMPPKTEEQPQA